MKYFLVALFAMLLVPVPAPAGEETGLSGNPVAAGEQHALTCYQMAEDYWNRTMDAAPESTAQLQISYLRFARCADVAVRTGRLIRGIRHPWDEEYFASTVGASYAQEQLSRFTSGSERCAHLQLAKDLIDQSLLTEQAHGPNPGWETDAFSRRIAVRNQLLMCVAHPTTT